MSTERRCPGCGTWYRKDEGACSMCGEPPAKFNKWLRTAQLNGHLFQQAAGSTPKAERAAIHGRALEAARDVLST